MNNDASLDPQHNRHAVTDLADARAHLISIIQQSRRYLHILSESLHPNLYDDESICAALSAFVRQNPNSHLRILVHDPVYLVKHGHKMMPLIRRLPSKISIRQITAPAGDFPFFPVISTSRFCLARKSVAMDTAVFNVGLLHNKSRRISKKPGARRKILPICKPCLYSRCFTGNESREYAPNRSGERHQKTAKKAAF